MDGRCKARNWNTLILLVPVLHFRACPDQYSILLGSLNFWFLCLSIMADPAAHIPLAQVVGHAFVQQYYLILFESPGLVHRFYQDISRVSRLEEDGTMSTTTTMKAIKAKIRSLNYGKSRIEIKYVDAQESWSGGVHVQVTGYLTRKDDIPKNFSQSFFLAPQDKGYFVLNDIFHYTGNGTHQENANHHEEERAPTPDVVAPVTPGQAREIAPVVEENIPGDAAVSTEESQAKEDVLVCKEVTPVQEEAPISDEDFTQNYFDDLAGFGTQPAPGLKSTSEVTQDVLESLFKTRKSKKHKPSNMNWKTVVKKMESFGEMLDYPSEDTLEDQPILAKGEDYKVYRNTASQLWDSVKSYRQKAASANENGKREHAAYLFDQARQCKEKARQADKKASQYIFNSRNKDFENLITIDLHGQHVKQGMKLLKLHLLFGAYARSVRLFRVVTGYGRHGVGKSKLKQSAIDLLESEKIEWNEETKGTLLIKLNGQREFSSFLDSGSDSE